MTEWVAATEDLPPGAHALSLHGSAAEGTRQMAGFVRGAFYVNQPALVVTNDDARLAAYREAIAAEQPWLVEAFHRIPGPHTYGTPEGLRPIDEPMAFANAHPRGASIAGDTISDFLGRPTLDAYLRYERWFDGLRPFPHRALCPYALHRMPIGVASEALGELVADHTHIVLSDDPNPSIRLLQLLAVPALVDAPGILRTWRERAEAHGLIVAEAGDPGGLRLTPRGRLVARLFRNPA